MNIDCNRCGARFDVNTTERRAFCPYCGELAVLPRIWTPGEGGSEPKAEAAPKKKPEKKPAAKPAPTKKSPGPGRAPSQDPVVVRPPRSRRGPVIALIALGVLGGAVALFFVGMRKVENRASSSGWFGGACTVDANGDAVQDLAGFFGWPSRATLPLSFIDGKTGEVIWSGGSYPFEQVKLLCLGPGAVGVDFQEGKVEIRSGRSPAEAGQVDVGGRIDSYGAGTGCVELVSGGASVVTGFDGRPVASCRADKRSAALPPGYTSKPTNNIWWQTVGSVTYTLIPDVGLSPFIIASAIPGSMPQDPYGAPMSGTAFHAALAAIPSAVWKTKLPYTVVFAAGVPALLVDEKLITWGNDPTRKDVGGVLIGLNVKDGSVAYATVQGSAWSNRLRELHYNGQYVVAVWGTGLFAYDAATGKEVWRVGG